MKATSTDYLKVISTRYYGPTNSKGARIRAFDDEGNHATVGFPHEKYGMDAHRVAAEALTAKMGWSGTMKGGGISGGYAFILIPEGDKS